jgi:hypothetical protein
MKTAIQISLALFLLVGLSFANAAGFQLKGVSLGMPAAQACGTAEVSSRLHELIQESTESIQLPSDIKVTECEVTFPSFGGVIPDQPAKLLFLNDELIVFKLELSGLTVSMMGDIRVALIDAYRKPKRTKSTPFITDTWKRNGETLLIEFTEPKLEGNDFLILLRHDAGYRKYQAGMKAITAQLEKQKAQTVKRDIR